MNLFKVNFDTQAQVFCFYLIEKNVLTPAAGVNIVSSLLMSWKILQRRPYKC